MSVDKSQALLKVIGKIQMFSNLGQESATLVLKACEFRTSEAGDIVCKRDDPSDDFSILLSATTVVGSIMPAWTLSSRWVSPSSFHKARRKYHCPRPTPLNSKVS